VLGGSLGLAVAALSRVPAAAATRGADPDLPWYSNWCTVVDGTTHGWLELETDDDAAISGFYGNEVGYGQITNCKFFEPYRLDCQWIQTSDGTRGTFSIRQNRKRTEFHGTYKKKGGGSGDYDGVFKRLRRFDRTDCCQDCFVNV
jgi:hypothetical protein